MKKTIEIIGVIIILILIIKVTLYKFKGSSSYNNYYKNLPYASYCTFDGELKKGAEYVNGEYIYRYMQEYDYHPFSGLRWVDIQEDGWGVKLTNKDSSEPVTSKLCTYINNKPIRSTSFTFAFSKSQSIDLSSFITTNVKRMDGMFYNIEALKIDVSNLDTSNVKGMSSMFEGGKIQEIIGLEKLNTSNVSGMGWMFAETNMLTLVLSNFDTSNVINMSEMFYKSKATTIKGLENFNTSNVENMYNMFSNSNITILNIKNFDTSKVENMMGMFSNSKITEIDISNFDTSNVTDMSHMFSSNKNLKTIYVGNKFNMNKVATSIGMFYGCTNLVGGSGTKYNNKLIDDKIYAHIDGGTNNPGYFTAK